MVGPQHHRASAILTGDARHSLFYPNRLLCDGSRNRTRALSRDRVLGLWGFRDRERMGLKVCNGGCCFPSVSEVGRVRELMNRGLRMCGYQHLMIVVK